MSDLAHPKLIAVIVAAIIAVVAIWISVFVSRWRRITWREHMDTQLGALPKERRDNGPWAIWKVLTHHEEVAQPSLVLVRLRNSGLLHISRADVRRPLTFTFPGRVIKEFTVTDCRGVSRQEIQPAGDLGLPQAEESTISLPRFPMPRRAGFKLLVLLSGAGRDIVVDGGLRRGRVLHESRARGPLTQNIAFGSVLLLLVGIQAGFTFGPAAAPSYCASGRLTIEGSTAFAPTAQAIGSAYSSACHGADISVSAIATFNGLNAVADAGSAGEPSAGLSTTGLSTTGLSTTGLSTTGRSGTGLSAAGLSSTAGTSAAAQASGAEQIAMSDGPAPSGYPTLVGHPIAVMVFAVVVNKRLGIYNLTTAQLRDIWLGEITNWDQVGGPSLSVKIVARTTASGTRRIFDQRILGAVAEPAFSSYNCVSKNAVPSSPVTRCEVSDTGTLLQKVNSIPGAIGYAQVSDAATYPDVSAIKINGSDPAIAGVEHGAYPYWTVEYLYTAGNPAPGSLAADFLSYMESTTSDDTLRSSDYTPCVDRGQSFMATLCGP